jgi:glutathione S-transferase
MPSITLYFAPGSCAVASLIALNEAGLPFKARKVKLADREQDSTWFRTLNPLGRVPVLAVDDEVVTETIAILSYAAHSNPDARLLPFGDPVAIAKAYEFMAWLASSVHVTIAQLWRTERFVDEPAAAAAVKAAAPERLENAFRCIDRSLAGPWALGPEFSLIDGYLGVFFRWAQRLEIDMSAFPRWAEHQSALLARPSVISALATEQTE